MILYYIKTHFFTKTLVTHFLRRYFSPHQPLIAYFSGSFNIHLVNSTATYRNSNVAGVGVVSTQPRSAGKRRWNGRPVSALLEHAHRTDDAVD